MRKLIMLTVAGVLFSAASLLQAAPRGEKVTIEGKGLCAKCALHETKTCQNVVIVTKDGKEINYYMERNAVAKKAHAADGFCKATKEDPIKVKVTGEVEEENGKWEIKADKIVKEKD